MCGDSGGSESSRGISSSSYSLSEDRSGEKYSGIPYISWLWSRRGVRGATEPSLDWSTSLNAIPAGSGLADNWGGGGCWVRTCFVSPLRFLKALLQPERAYGHSRRQGLWVLRTPGDAGRRGMVVDLDRKIGNKIMGSIAKPTDRLTWSSCSNCWSSRTGTGSSVPSPTGILLNLN